MHFEKGAEGSLALIKSILYVALLGALSHFIGEALPRKWFVWSRFPWRDYGWERNGKIYDVLKIRVWKDRLPDMSRVVKRMVPKRVGRCPSSADVWRLVRETCVAEAVHFALCLLAPGIWFFWKNTVGILLMLLYLLCNLPFILIQRYNRPTLVALAERLEIREERKKHARIDSVG